MSARWLTPEVDVALERLDAQLWQARKTGALQITVHYRGGRPQVARAHEVVTPPMLVEMSLSLSATSS